MGKSQVSKGESREERHSVPDLCHDLTAYITSDTAEVKGQPEATVQI